LAGLAVDGIKSLPSYGRDDYLFPAKPNVPPKEAQSPLAGDVAGDPIPGSVEHSSGFDSASGHRTYDSRLVDEEGDFEQFLRDGGSLDLVRVRPC